MNFQVVVPHTPLLSFVIRDYIWQTKSNKYDKSWINYIQTYMIMLYIYIYRLYHYGRCIYIHTNLPPSMRYILKPTSIINFAQDTTARPQEGVPQHHGSTIWGVEGFGHGIHPNAIPDFQQKINQMINGFLSFVLTFWVSVSVWWDGFRSCKYSVVGWSRMIISWRKTSIFTWINYSRRNFDTASTKLGEWQINLKQTTQWKFNLSKAGGGFENGQKIHQWKPFKLSQWYGRNDYQGNLHPMRSF